MIQTTIYQLLLHEIIIDTNFLLYTFLMIKATDTM